MNPTEIALDDAEVTILQMLHSRLAEAGGLVRARQEDIQIFSQWVMERHNVNGPVRLDLGKRMIVAEKNTETSDAVNP